MNYCVDEKEDPTNEEMEALDKKSGPQQEIRTSNKDTGSLGLENAKINVVTISECRIANKASITLTKDAPWEGDSK